MWHDPKKPTLLKMNVDDPQGHQTIKVAKDVIYLLYVLMVAFMEIKPTQ